MMADMAKLRITGGNPKSRRYGDKPSMNMSTTAHGVVILLFCATNAFLIFYPYAEPSDKGWELSLLPLITAIVLVLSSIRERIRNKIDILLLVFMAAVSICTFWLPDPTYIWIMMVFMFCVYIPAFLMLFARGAYFICTKVGTGSKN